MPDISKLHELFKPLFPGLLDVELTDIEPKRIDARMLVRKDLSSGQGALHWGASVGLAQTLGSVGSTRNLPEGSSTRTLTSNTVFHADAPTGTTVTATCILVEINDEQMTWQTTIRNEEGALCAVVTQQQAIIND